MLVGVVFPPAGLLTVRSGDAVPDTEFFGVVTNRLAAGWGTYIGLNPTMAYRHGDAGGRTVDADCAGCPPSVPLRDGGAGLSGVAKDLNKMSAKASVKAMVGMAGESTCSGMSHR